MGGKMKKENLHKRLNKELEKYHLKDHNFFVALIFTIKRLERRIESLEKQLQDKN